MSIGGTVIPICIGVGFLLGEFTTYFYNVGATVLYCLAAHEPLNNLNNLFDFLIEYLVINSSFLYCNVTNLHCHLLAQGFC